MQNADALLPSGAAMSGDSVNATCEGLGKIVESCSGAIVIVLASKGARRLFGAKSAAKS